MLARHPDAYRQDQPAKDGAAGRRFRWFGCIELFVRPAADLRVRRDRSTRD